MDVTVGVESEEKVKCQEQRETQITPIILCSWYLFHRKSDFSCVLSSWALMQQNVVEPVTRVETEAVL